MKKITVIFFVFMMGLKAYPQGNPSKVDVGDKAFDIKGLDETGKEIKLSDYYGEKYILLNVTATYCNGCWKTYDHMNEAQDKYGDKLKVISFHYDDLRDQWNKIAKHSEIDFRCTSIWEAENKSQISKTYQIDGFPYFFIIDKEGIIVEKWLGISKIRMNWKLKKYL
ncbi:MAG: TlpA disulfide reductase family protein [Bacteroidales bacterium]